MLVWLVCRLRANIIPTLDALLLLLVASIIVVVAILIVVVCSKGWFAPLANIEAVVRRLLREQTTVLVAQESPAITLLT